MPEKQLSNYSAYYVFTHKLKVNGYFKQFKSLLLVSR